MRSDVLVGGYVLSYLQAGAADDPVVLLLHGLASDSETWDRALEPLAARGFRVLALDLIGHGRSDKPDTSYELAELAASVKAFLDAVGVESATLCGHSWGGAIAMAVASEYPATVDALVLVSAGGLGREVHPLLRAAALPVAPYVLRAATRPRLRRWYNHPRVHRALRLTEDNLVNLRRAGRALGDPNGQSSFFASLRGVIEVGGQRGSFIDMGRLSAERPTLLLWTEGDPVIPVAHARAAHAHLPGSRLVVLPGGGHEPHRRDPERFADEVAAFLLSH
ncbi:alpha/beta fold hydrolase [uncultured Jatrophihabitans sp.]|uniref:alpha/beta fold hydrolase n=1 Tax=uncultured Jatrophihabitans sp. TaxID=1610747 RepID=UPI0035CADA7D